MTNHSEEKLESLIKYEKGSEDLTFRQWFLKQFDADAENPCSLEEFAVYFLNTLRQYTEGHLKTSGLETPNCQTPVRAREVYKNGEVVTSKRLLQNLSQDHISAPNDNLNRSRNNSSIEFNRLSTSLDRMGLSYNSTSTPAKYTVAKNSRRQSPAQGSYNKSCTSSLCLGDFLILDKTKTSRTNKKKSSSTLNQQSAQKLENEKPKKRVQPISISKKDEKSNNSSSIFAGESSFSNENNILKLSNTELEDKNQCAILAARKSLALNPNEITDEIEKISMPLISAVPDTITTSTPVKENMVGEILDVKKLQNYSSLKRLAEIYALIIDFNLTSNILSELSLLVNLLNTSNSNSGGINETSMQVDEFFPSNNHANSKWLSMLENLKNANCFALLCLEQVKEYLAYLDTKSLGVVLISENFSLLPEEVQTYLLEMYRSKQQMVAEKPFCETSLCFYSKTCSNVYFQHDQDSRENFTSHEEFTNFRAQRDLFYKCLKTWETNHLNPMWQFTTEIAPQIKEIFQVSENCINMAHLAKLFVSQLLLSASNATSPEEIGLDVDHHKFSKLSQRLITPSQFSVDYQFPRTEAFFRDFILNARSISFLEQVKMELYRQLITQNDSSLDHINISRDENNANGQTVSLNDYTPSDQVVVRPDILNSMLVLGKFLGFTISLPYNISDSNTLTAKIEKNQMTLRSLMQSTFDVCSLLEQAIQQNKLLIVIPWLVQCFAMLDNITLQLENYMKTMKLLFALYSYFGLKKSNCFCTTSVFIIKLCLGWLFESKQFIAEQYYNFRANLRGRNSQESSYEWDFIKSKLKSNFHSYSEPKSSAPNPYLESLLPIACPFLAEFRVSIMPAKYAQIKNASRTGRYRHITTRFAELDRSLPIKQNVSSSNIAENKFIDTQKSLIQAFLNAQNSSTRQIIKFCTERCYKSTIKDGQLKILLPAKSNADNLVNQITSFQYQFVDNAINAIYEEAYTHVKAEWKNCMPNILHRRINNALESLLPEETSSILKKTYFVIIEKEASIKISEWFYENIIRDNYFCPNLSEMVAKICNANKNKVQLGSTQLTIVRDTPSVSDLIDELQYWLHCTSIRLDRFKDSTPLVHLFTNLLKSFDNELPAFLYHLLGTGIVQMFQHIVIKHCTHLTNELIEVGCQVWLHPNMQKALDTYSSSGICIYDPLITITFIESVGTKTECFHRLGHLLISMIKKHVITVNYVNELFVSIFKYEWHPLILTEISNMLKSIAKEASELPQKPHGKNNENRNRNNDVDDDSEKSNLFMDMLADLSRDIDFF